MRKNRSLERLAVDLGHMLACEEVESVLIVSGSLDNKIALRLSKCDNGLEQRAFALLYVLAERVEVGREYRRSREDSLVLLALALAEELLEPLAHHGVVRLIGGHHFDLLAASVENVADSGIAIAVVLVKFGRHILLSRVCGALHKCVDIDSGDRYRKQADCGEHGISPADVIGNYESLIALFVGHIAKRAL